MSPALLSNLTAPYAIESQSERRSSRRADGFGPNCMGRRASARPESVRSASQFNAGVTAETPTTELAVREHVIRNLGDKIIGFMLRVAVGGRDRRAALPPVPRRTLSRSGFSPVALVAAICFLDTPRSFSTALARRSSLPDW